MSDLEITIICFAMFLIVVAVLKGGVSGSPTSSSTQDFGDDE